MDNPKGRVVSLIDGADGEHAIVEVDVAASCPRCAAGKGCGAGLLTRGATTRQIEATIQAGLEITENDLVEIALAPDNLLQAALLVYGLPLAGAILAAAIAYGMSLGDVSAAVAALIGLGLGVLVGRWRLSQTSCLRQFVPSVVRLR